jgi:hypothetical protein
MSRLGGNDEGARWPEHIEESLYDGSGTATDIADAAEGGMDKRCVTRSEAQPPEI